MNQAPLSPALLIQKVSVSGRCFYCTESVREKWEIERDHFPVADRHGGLITVQACRRCHFLKDRQLHLPDVIWRKYAVGITVGLAASVLLHAERPSSLTHRSLTKRALGAWQSLNWETRLIIARTLCGRGAPRP